MLRRVPGIFAASLAATLVLGACSTGSTAPTGTPAAGGTGAGGGGGSATQPAGGNGGNGDVTGMKACSMLSTAEIQSAIDVTVKDGVEQDTDTQVSCNWDSEDDTAGVSVSVSKLDDTLWNTLSSAQNAKPVTGLGDAAFSGYPHAGDLSIKTNGYEVDLGIVDFQLDSAKTDAAGFTFATLVLSRL